MPLEMAQTKIIDLEPSEGFFLGFMIRLGFCGLIGFQYLGVLVLMIRVLLSVRQYISYWRKGLSYRKLR